MSIDPDMAELVEMEVRGPLSKHGLADLTDDQKAYLEQMQASVLTDDDPRRQSIIHGRTPAEIERQSKP